MIGTTGAVADGVHDGVDAGLVDLTGLPAGFLWAAAAGTDPTAPLRAPGAVVDLTGADAGPRRGRRRAAPSAALGVLDLARRGGVRVLEAVVPWRAVLPAGRGPVDAAAVGRLDRWVDEVLAAGVTPWLVLHADDAALPDAVRDAGGWAARDTARAFAGHATAVHAAVADRVAHWTTLGAAAGPTGAPGSLAAAHHRFVGHTLALAGMRGQAPADHRFGLTLQLAGVRPGAGVDTADAVLVDGLLTRWWLDAVLRGRYPADALAALEKAGERADDVVGPGDLAAAARPDLLGVRYPGDLVLAPAGPDGPTDDSADDAALPAVPAVVPADPGALGTASGRHVTPAGLTGLLARIRRDHPDAPPLLVSAPAAYADDDAAVAAALAGEPAQPVDDPARVEHLLAHVAAVAAAARAGAGVAGYLAGPLVDAAGGPADGLARRDPAGGDPRARRSLDVLRAAVASATAADVAAAR